MSVEQKAAKWNRFYDLSSEEKTIVLIEYQTADRPWPMPDNRKERMDWAVERYLWQKDAESWLDDDGLPCLRPYTGTEIFAAAYGSDVHYSGDNMPFARPLIFSAEEVSSLRAPDVRSGSLGALLEQAQELRDRTDAHALVQLPDIQSPLDIAALIWEKSDFLMSMLTEPQAVHDITHMTYETLTGFLDAWFAAFGTSYIAHYPDYYMEGGLTISEDEIGEVGTPLFEEFALGFLNSLSERYGGIAVHCCAHATHQWAGFKKIKGLRLLNLVQPVDVTKRAYESFSGVCAQYHQWCGDGLPSKEWIENTPADAHVVLHARAATKQEAIERAAALRELEAMRK